MSGPADMERLEEDIIFQDILISTLDEASDDYTERLAEIQAEKAEMETQLEQMRRSHSYANGQSNGVPPGYEPIGSHGDAWFGSGILEPKVLKRTRGDSYSDWPSAHPSKRATPDRSTAGTPSSSSSFEIIENPWQAQNGIPNMNQKMWQRQMAEEARIKREREDQELALRLSQQHNQGDQRTALPSSSRNAFQTTIGSNGSYHRPVKQEPSFLPSSGSPALPGRNFQQNSSQSALNARAEGTPPNRRSIKPEFQSPTTLAQRPRNNTVVDLTGDSDEDEEITLIQPPHVQHRNMQRLNEHTTNSGYSANSSYGTNPPFGTHPALNILAAARTPYQLPHPQMPGAWPSSSYGGQSVYGRGVHSTQSNNGSGYQVAAGFGSAYSSNASHFNTDLEQLNMLINGTSSRPYEVNSDDEDHWASHRDLWHQRYDEISNNDPAKTKEEIEALLNNIRPDQDLPEHLLVPTPESMNVRLHKYQESGLTWLRACEDGTNKGGILADDMGLGKTIQMLSLMVSNKSDNLRSKTTLIVAPVALLRQWKQEIEQKVKPGSHRLSVFTHHGPTKKKTPQELMVYDVVLTTYGSLASELKKMEQFAMRQKANGDQQIFPNAKERCALLGTETPWYRIILDEAQCIKNRNTRTAKGSFLINATYRWCCTGTPMMNNIEELYSLIHFLRIKPYCQWEKFRMDFVTPLKGGNENARKHSMQRLQTVCKAIMLRRTKSSTYEGRPILILPERTTEVDNPTFNEDEQAFYAAVEGRSRLQFNKYLKRGTVGSSYSAILVLLLRLRQACCHPHLLKDFGVAAVADLSNDQLVELAKELPEDAVKRIRETDGNFECAVCMDGTTSPAIFVPCGHWTCHDDYSKIADAAMATADVEGGRAAAKCPMCRNPIDAKRITDLPSFIKVHWPEKLDPSEQVEDDNDDDEADSESDSDETDSDSDDEDEDDTLGGFIVRDDEVDDEAETESESDNEEKPGISSKTESVKAEDEETEDDLDGPVKDYKRQATSAEKNGSCEDDGIKGNGKAKKVGKDKKSKKSKKSKGKQKKKQKVTLTLAELKKLGQRNIPARKKYLKRLRKEWIPSTKIEKTMELLQQVMLDKQGEKVLIFSQWTSLLDLLEVPIDEAGWGYRRYDGSMNPRARGDAVDDFRDSKKDVRIMLVSLKAGNAGLNLNMASQVIILDPFWNPYIEEQAIDRAHRLGQQRPVTVHRILIKETVEDRIIALQEKKRALISEALDEKAGQNIARLGVQELAYLFGVTSNANERVAYVPRQSRR